MNLLVIATLEGNTVETGTLFRPEVDRFLSSRWTLLKEIDFFIQSVRNCEKRAHTTYFTWIRCWTWSIVWSISYIFRIGYI